MTTDEFWNVVIGEYFSAKACYDLWKEDIEAKGVECWIWEQVDIARDEYPELDDDPMLALNVRLSARRFGAYAYRGKDLPLSNMDMEDFIGLPVNESIGW